MLILLFGSKKCQFCALQIEYIKKSFGQREGQTCSWGDIDILEDKSHLDWAEQLGVKNIPSIVIINDENENIFCRGGTLPCDQIFNIIRQKNNMLPLTYDQFKDIKEKKKNLIMYSIDFGIKQKQEILVSLFNNTDGGIRCIVKNIQKIDLKKYNKNSNVVKEYLEIGGRKDISYLFEIEKL